jgi:hypothetical protein
MRHDTDVVVQRTGTKGVVVVVAICGTVVVVVDDVVVDVLVDVVVVTIALHAADDVGVIISGTALTEGS